MFAQAERREEKKTFSRQITLIISRISPLWNISRIVVVGDEICYTLRVSIPNFCSPRPKTKFLKETICSCGI